MNSLPAWLGVGLYCLVFCFHVRHTLAWKVLENMLQNAHSMISAAVRACLQEFGTAISAEETAKQLQNEPQKPVVSKKQNMIWQMTNNIIKHQRISKHTRSHIVTHIRLHDLYSTIYCMRVKLNACCIDMHVIRWEKNIYQRRPPKTTLDTRLDKRWTLFFCDLCHPYVFPQNCIRQSEHGSNDLCKTHSLWLFEATIFPNCSCHTSLHRCCTLGLLSRNKPQ